MKIHWGRILIAGFVAEELQLASVLFSHRYGSLAMTIVALLSSFVFMLLGALWVTRILNPVSSCTVLWLVFLPWFSSSLQ